MNLRDLEYALAVAEHLSFSRAAQACHTTQSTLSGQIKKLEERLGVALFERSNRKVMVTREGEALLELARQATHSANAIYQLAQSYRDPYAGDLRLGAFPTLAPYYFPRMVPVLRAQFPAIKPFFVEEKSEVLLQQLHAGDLDAALLALPLAEEGLQETILFEEPFYVATPPGHPLAKKKHVCHADLEEHPLLLLEEGHCLRAQALELCSMHGLRQEQSFRATSLETLRSMVGAGSGITLIPRIAQRADDGIVYIPFSAPSPSRTIALVWRKTSPRITLMQKLSTLLQHSIRL